MKLITLIMISVTLGISPALGETLTPVAGFGENPGAISMYKYVPEGISGEAALVVSLHGCRQDAETYSRNGWLDIANQGKFYLVFPEQNPLNNVLNCWNWFEAGNIERGKGEVHSIKEMIDRMQADYAIDSRRIYIEGLSAGGYMVPIMLAAYPDVFAGGASNAGGPAFCAMTEKPVWDFFNWWFSYFARANAKKCMRGVDKSPQEWARLVKQEGYQEFNGDWPTLSIWHGENDETVDIENQTELLEQWTSLHGIDRIPEIDEQVPPGSDNRHQVYHDSEGQPRVETWVVTEMAHGTPIDAGVGQACGQVSDYILDAGLCAVKKIAAFWGLNTPR